MFTKLKKCRPFTRSFAKSNNSRNSVRLPLQPLESREVPAIDLCMVSVTPEVPDSAVPGQGMAITVKIKNKGEERATADFVRLRIFASVDKTAFYENDPLLAEGFIGGFDVPARATRSFSMTFQLPALGSYGQPIGPGVYGPTQLVEERYHYLAFIDAPLVTSSSGQYFNIDGSDVFPEPDFHFNNLGFIAEKFLFSSKFGTVNGKKGEKVTVLSGNLADPKTTVKTTFSIRGEGVGELIFNGLTYDLVLNGTNKESRVIAESDGSDTRPIRHITASTPIDFLDMERLDVIGNITFSGGLSKLIVRDLGAGTAVDSLVTIGAGLGEMEYLGLREAKDVDLTAAGGIKKLDIFGQWTDANGSDDMITAPFIKDLDTRQFNGSTGNFEASLNVTLPGIDGYGLKNANIKGIIRNAVWNVAGKVKSLKIENKSKVATAAEKWGLIASGRVETLLIAGDFNNTGHSGRALEAEIFGDIDIKGDLIGATEIKANGTEPKTNVSIGKLEMRKVMGLVGLTAANGGIHTLNATDWQAGTAIQAKWMHTLEIKVKGPKDENAYGDFNASAFVLTGFRPKTDVSLEKADIKRQLSGDWHVFADVEEIRAQQVHFWNYFGGKTQGSPGSLLRSLVVEVGSRSTGGHLEYSVIDTDAIGIISVDGVINGTIKSNSTEPVIGIFGGNIKAVITINGDIDMIAASEINGATINVGGSVRKKIRIEQEANGTTFNFFDSVNIFQAGKMIGCTVYALFERINVFRITADKDEDGPQFSGTNVYAGLIGLVVLHDVDESPSKPIFKIQADSISNYARYKEGKRIVSEKLLTDPAIVDVAGKYALVIE